MMKIFYLLLLLFIASLSNAQTPNQLLRYDFYHSQKLDFKIYNSNSNFHSAIKPYFADDSVIALAVDSMLNIGLDTGRASFLKRKLFQEHLVEIKAKDYKIYIDFLPDFIFGKELEENKNTFVNTRGFQIEGTIGTKFSFYTSAYENQSLFPAYLQNYINKQKVIPSQTNDNFGPSKTIKDYSYVATTLSYTPNKYLNITLGQDKNFIGDGYRSMLLSDVATNYPFLKLTGTLGKVKYMSLWAQFQDLTAPQFSYDNGFRKKWGVFHYLDWNVSNRLSLGFFDAVIWQDADSLSKRGFDYSYLNPLAFLRPVERQNGSPDNALIGFNASYKVLKNVSLYAQLLIDEFSAKYVFDGSGNWANKFGYQFGFRSYNIFGIKGLKILSEVNIARPYTYTQRSSLLNYAHYNEALAHPFGANFKEWLSIISYSIKRLNFSAELLTASYGLDAINDNFGKDLFKSYDTRESNIGNFIGQGIETRLNLVNVKTSYLINPNYNLRIELESVFRNENNKLLNQKTNWFNVGLRSSFRNLYHDF